MSVLVVGSIALDTIKTPRGKKDKLLGGSATHFSLAARVLSRVRMVGVVGTDFPEKYLKYLKKKEINTDGVKIAEGETFKWSGYYEKDMGQAHTLQTILGVFQDFQPEIPKAYENSEIIFLANIDPDLQLKVLSYIKKYKFSVSDTMNFWIDKKPSSVLKVLKKVDCALFNDAEIRQLFKENNLITAAKKCLAFGPSFIIVKKGEHGAVLFTKKAIYSAVAYPVENVVDPTGAGDSFAGGFCSYLDNKAEINDQNLRKAIVYGNLVASFNVQGFGTSNLDNLTSDKIRKRFLGYQQIIIRDEI